MQEETFYFTDLYTGRPTEPRTQEEDSCYDLLDQLGIAYDRVDHDPADSIEKCHLLEPVLGVSATKNLFLRDRQRAHWYLLLMPGDKPFRTSVLSKQLGIARLSFGEEEQMQQYLGVHPGSVSILGLKNDKNREVRFLIDRDVLNGLYLRCHPCINTSTLRIRREDAMDVLFPYIRHIPTIVNL